MGSWRATPCGDERPVVSDVDAVTPQEFLLEVGPQRAIRGFQPLMNVLNAAMTSSAKLRVAILSQAGHSSGIIE